MIETESTVVPHRPPQQSRGMAALALVLLLLFPIAYVLSVGPACLLVNEHILEEQVLETVYAPIIIVSDWSPTIGECMGWYVELWTD
jgi:hypothetical protein